MNNRALRLRLSLGVVAALVAVGLSVISVWADATPTPPSGGTIPIPPTATSTPGQTIPAATPTATSAAPAATPTTTPPPAATATSVATSTAIATATATATAAAAPGVPHDNRYFSQTGFRIDNDTIWDYFNRRGGVNTFGYPTSRTFTLQGFAVQFFQRRIVQLGPNGQARLLNTLDPGIMPYSSFNGAQMPSYDSALVTTAPSPTDAAATLAWVQAHAPDSWQGLPVNFYQTFVNTVTAPVAFPTGGDPSLLPGFNLEMWGIPTSNPQFDPNNRNFVYLRFQRGIMHFDAGCTCTQGILLADYLKAIMTGQNLPADLNQEAQGSAFYLQYDPNAPNWVHNPSLLPNTNLTNAFTQE